MNKIVSVIWAVWLIGWALVLIKQWNALRLGNRAHIFGNAIALFLCGSTSIRLLSILLVGGWPVDKEQIKVALDVLIFLGTCGYLVFSIQLGFSILFFSPNKIITKYLQEIITEQDFGRFLLKNRTLFLSQDIPNTRRQEIVSLISKRILEHDPIENYFGLAILTFIITAFAGTTFVALIFKLVT